MYIRRYVPKTAVWPHQCITRYGSTVYIGIAKVFVFPPYIREILSVISQLDF